jgi:hypothetical protein
MAGVIPAVDPAETSEQGQELEPPAARALARIPEIDGAGPLAGLGASLHEVLGSAIPAQSSGGPSQHLSPGQFGSAIGEGGAGVGEMGAAAPASGLAELAPLAAL